MYESKALDVLSQADRASGQIANIDSAVRDLSHLINVAWYDDVGTTAFSSLTQIGEAIIRSAKNVCSHVTNDMSAVRSYAIRLNTLSSELEKITKGLKTLIGDLRK